jgi:hypothetical protein
VLRPPIAQERLELTADGKVLLRLRRTWRDGTRAIHFEPTELLEKLAAMIPKPRINLLLYHGVFAPHARHRPGAVRRAQEGAQRLGTSPGAASEAGNAGTASAASGGGAQDSPPAPGPSPPPTVPGAGSDSQALATARPPPPNGYTRPKHYAWADLLQRTFAVDVLACPECGGRLRFLATIEDRAVIEKILGHLDLPVDVPSAAPARVAEWLPGVD